MPAQKKNSETPIIRSIFRWILPWVVMFIVAPLFGYKVIPKKTIKMQAEKLGIGLRDSKSPVFLTQEYPAVEGISYRDQINLGEGAALMKWQEGEQPFWVGMQSRLEDKNYKNPTIFLNFKGKVNVRVDAKASVGWVEMDPNFSYYIKYHGDIQPLTGCRVNPLFVEFPNEDIYFVEYTITGDDEIPIRGVFPIIVKQKLVAKRLDK